MLTLLLALSHAKRQLMVSESKQWGLNRSETVVSKSLSDDYLLVKVETPYHVTNLNFTF